MFQKSFQSQPGDAHVSVGNFLRVNIALRCRGQPGCTALKGWTDPARTCGSDQGRLDTDVPSRVQARGSSLVPRSFVLARDNADDGIKPPYPALHLLKGGARRSCRVALLITSLSPRGQHLLTVGHAAGEEQGGPCSVKNWKTKWPPLAHDRAFPCAGPWRATGTASRVCVAASPCRQRKKKGVGWGQGREMGFPTSGSLG